MKISAIAAIDLAYGLGHQGKLLWKLPSDLRRFRGITLGHTVIVGHTTHVAMGRALPGRTTIVLSRNPAYVPTDALVARSLDDAIDLAKTTETHQHPEAIVMGGADVFAQALPRCTRLYLSLVGNIYPADVYFPRAWGDGWERVRSEAVPADASHTDPHLFVLFERSAPQGYSGPSPLPIPQ